MRRNIRLDIQRKKTTTDWDNSQDEWEHVAWAWCSREPLRGREYLDAQQMTATVTHRLEMDYMPGIVPSMRGVDHEGKVMEFVSVANVGDRNRRLEIAAIEVV